MDQGLFATSNFVLNILLARWLTLQEYGAFALAFALFLLVGNLYQAAFLEPMLVFGPGKYKDRLQEYLGALVYGHLAFATLGSLAFLLAGLGLTLWGARELAGIISALGLVLPLIFLLWLMRRACYARLEPHLAALGSAWYMAFMLAGAYFLYRNGWLSGASALGVMGISSLAVSAWLTVRLGVKLPSLHGGKLIRDSFNDHWRYGRWSLMNQGLNWIPSNAYYLILPIWGGLAAGASFKALMNLMMPMLQGISALSILLLPVLVRARARGRSRFDSQVRLALIPFVLGPTLCWVMLGLLSNPLVSLLYGGRYTEHSGLLWLIGFSAVCSAVTLVVGHALRALERPDQLFQAFAASAAAACILGIGFVYLWGLPGAATSFLISQMILTALVLIFYRRSRCLRESSHFWGASPEREGVQETT